MRYVIIRDDDTNALTPVACLEHLYRPFLDRGLPVNLAAIPDVSTDTRMAQGTLEGYLFPNKYRIYRRTTAEQLCRMMREEFRARWNALNTQADVHNTITLASMVEREARLPEERPLVASVFRNRLQLGMKLPASVRR